ncbi:MAG: RND family transporter [Nitrospinales bacterium]
MNSWLLRCYEKVVLANPWATLVVVTLFVGFFAYQVPNFKLDASAESLVLENDDDLRYYRNINKIYGSDDFLIITYTPFDDLLSENSLAGIRALRDELLKLKKVKSIVSILDVPLLNSPKVKISELNTNVRTLETPGLDKELARKEFLESPIYRNRLVSLDGKTTALQVNFKRDEKYFSLLYKRNDLRDKQSLSGLTSEESRELEKVSEEFRQYHDTTLDEQSRLIETVREIMDRQRDKAKMFLGGIPMIISDMIDFIKHDLEVFGFGVAFFLILALAFFFGKLRWVLLPMFCCSITVLVMLGYVSFLEWRVTVISSNFVSILLIITMSLTIHLIVRYRDLNAENPHWDQRTLVRETVRLMTQPCFYTAITTIVAFCSLVVSDIRPVIDFGWMMTIGIALAFVLNFVFFPAALMLLKPEKAYSSQDFTRFFTMAVASFTKKNGNKILIFCLVLAVISAAGVLKLEVENRFIDNFKSTTEIYRGMEVIDQKLGGTTPLDIIIDPDEEFYASLKESATPDTTFEDPFADPFTEEGGETQKEEDNYWFHEDMLRKVEAIREHLESMSEVGKVMSIATVIKVFTDLNDGQMPDDFDLALLRKLAPGKVKDALVSPYLSDDANEIRINMRLIESDPTLRRKALIEKIRRFLVEDMKFSEDQIKFTGMVVLYNNMLQSLYKSQITTIGLVFVVILIMFMILFRSVNLATLAIVPNMLAACLVLGIMGWLGIPLDMMTITIAAITIGIAVDDTIHYIHRFKSEFELDHDYSATLDRCHGSIGRAIYYTSITVTAGFSILALSDFSPTIYFGLLTGLAMLVALLFNLTLLPALIVLFKPLGLQNNKGMQPDPSPATTN